MNIQWLNIILYLNDTKIPYQQRQYQQKRKQYYGGHVPFMDIKKKENLHEHGTSAATASVDFLDSNHDSAATFVVKNQPTLSGASWNEEFSSFKYDSNTLAKPFSEYLCFPCPVLIPSNGGSSSPASSTLDKSFIQISNAVIAAPGKRLFRFRDHWVEVLDIILV